MLLQCGASPDIFGGHRFYEWTLFLNTPPILALMTRYGMNPDHIDEKGRTRLHYVSNGDLNVFVSKLAMMSGLDPNIQDNQGWTALHYALSYGDWELTELYLPVTDVSLKTNRGETALHILLDNWDEWAGDENRKKALVGILQQRSDSFDLEAHNKKSYTALGLAMRNGSFRAIRTLVAAGCSVNSKNYKERTPLHLAIRYSDHDEDKYFRKAICPALIQDGADVDAVCSDGHTPLMEFMDYPDFKIMRQLLQANSSGRVTLKDLQDNEICRLMRKAILNGATDCAEFMFQDSCSLNEDQDLQQRFIDLSMRPESRVNQEDFGETETIGLYGLLREQEILDATSLDLSPPPLSLYRLCRLAMRASLPKGPAFLKAVDQLPVASLVRDFIALR